jgi:hypothetical protein
VEDSDSGLLGCDEVMSAFSYAAQLQLEPLKITFTKGHLGDIKNLVSIISNT